MHAGNFTSPSDARLKTNINENVPGLEFIKHLRPVTYNSKDDSEFRSTQFLKQVSLLKKLKM